MEYLKISKLYRFLMAQFLMAMMFFAGNPLYGVWQQPPTVFTPTGGSSIDVAADANGHAFAVYDSSFGDQVNASYYSSGFWSLPTTIGTGASIRNIDIDMDDTGTALAIWYDNANGAIGTAHFNGAVWNTPALNPLDTITFPDTVFPRVAMNGPNQGVAFWGDSTTGDVESSFFIGTNWTAPTTIATGQTTILFTDLAYSSNGDAVAIWATNTQIVAANLIGGVWQPAVILDPTTGISPVSVGIDSAGHAHATWINATSNVVTRFFDGTTWQPIQVQSGTGNSRVVIDVAPGGTAVLTWVDSSGIGQSRAFDGTTWGPIMPFSTSIVSGFNTLSVDNDGNALAVFEASVGGLSQIRSARLPVGGVWCPEEIVEDDVGDEGLFILRSALSSDGTGFAVWAPPSEGLTFSGSATLPPTPPLSLEGRTCTNKFATQTDRVNIITFVPSTDLSVIAYELRRNGILIATIAASGPYIFFDHNRCRGTSDVYTLTAIQCGNVESEPLTLIL